MTDGVHVFQQPLVHIRFLRPLVFPTFLVGVESEGWDMKKVSCFESGADPVSSFVFQVSSFKLEETLNEN